MKLYIGIDQSFTSTGWVILDSNQLLQDFGRIQTGTLLNIFERAEYIAETLSAVAKRYRVSGMNMEGLAFGAVGKANKDLAGLQFTIWLAFKRSGFNMSLVKLTPPTSLKKFATGSGRASKEDMINALPEAIRQAFVSKLGKKIDDVADAYWLARMLAGG